MKKFTKWHKEFANKFMKKTGMDSYQLAWFSWAKGLIMGIILMVFLSGCYVYSGAYAQEQTAKHSCELMDRGQACLSDHSCCKDDTDEVSYWRANYASTLDIYYYNSLPYWGYYSGHYYYYGYRHNYPWWYYYNFTPPYYYGATTHVHCHIGNSGYVYRPRGNWRHNNKTHLTYHHDKVNNTGINVKDRSNVPTKWRNNNVKIKNNTKVNVTPVKTTKVKTNVRNVDNKITPVRVKTNKTNTNRTNIKVNTNRNNIKVNTNKNKNRTTIKTNTNKSNSRGKTTKRPR